MNWKLITLIVAVLLLLPFTLKVQAEDYVVDADTLLLWDHIDSTSIIAASAISDSWLAVATGSITADVWHSVEKHDTTKEYITSIDTGYVHLRKDCDTVKTTIFEGNDSIPMEIRLDLENCRNIYRLQIDTGWAEKLVARFTPDELEALMNWLRAQGL